MISTLALRVQADQPRELLLGRQEVPVLGVAKRVAADTGTRNDVRANSERRPPERKMPQLRHDLVIYWGVQYRW